MKYSRSDTANQNCQITGQKFLGNILTRLIGLLFLCLSSVCYAKDRKLVVGLIGDSTVAQQSGWGPAFSKRFGDDVVVLNHAVNGATLQALSKKLEMLLKEKPQYVFVQLGHNDQKRYDIDTYVGYLKSYSDRMKKAGGIPIIVSSVTRRTFTQEGKIVSTMSSKFKANLTEYAKAALKFAKDEGLKSIDLHSSSIAHHNAIGPAMSMEYNFKEGDKTHFNEKGANAITDLILKDLKVVMPELAKHLK